MTGSQDAWSDPAADGGLPGRGRRGRGIPGRGLPGRDEGPADDSAEGTSHGGGDPVEAARAICLRMLAAGPRTRAQLAQGLQRRRVPAGAADAVLSRFAEVGLIDDAAFARAWVESRHHGRALARRALAAELKQRGVAPEEVRAATSAVGPQDEAATARRLVARRLPATRGRPLPARVRRLVGMLARKGYPAGLAYQVVREALAQEEPGAGDTGHDLDEITAAGLDGIDDASGS